MDRIPRSILVFLAQSNPNRPPMSAQQKARLEKRAASLPQRRVVPLVRK